MFKTLFSRGNPPKIISVHSFRGGTGKSNVTANLAATIASQGFRIGIIDTDIQSPGIHILFGQDEQQFKYTLNDYLWGRCPVEKAAYDVTFVLKQNGSEVHRDSAIYLIPSSIKVGEISKILREGYSVSRLNDGFKQIIQKLKLDYLIIDTHPGLNEETLLSISVSDVLVLIMRPDRQDFQGTAVTVEVARKLSVPKLLITVNKALPEFDFKSLKQQIETTYKAPVAGILPLCDEMVRLASSDIFCLRYFDHPLTREVNGIATLITQS
jgi:MinD-like ATPase involved in chromosome partitioning or flagellar assembly